MKRGAVLNVAAGVFCAVVVGGCLRSFGTEDRLSVASGGGEIFGVRSRFGVLIVEVPKGTRAGGAVAGGVRLGRRDVAGSYAPVVTEPPVVSVAGVWIGGGTRCDFVDYRASAVPHWVLLAVGGVAWAGVARRGRRLGGRGVCAACGYDLRATPGRCPECGRVVEGVET